MHGTHCKHCSLIPPLVFNKNLASLRCGYMCTGTLDHISRHLGKTSNNNNKRCQLWIHCMLCRVCFHWILHWISGLWPLLYYGCLHPALPLMFYSINLLLSTYSTMCIPCLMSFAIYPPVSACMFSRHGFQCMFIIQIYRYTSVYLCMPLGISITTRRGVLTPLNPHVQVSELGACGFSQLLT